jgi:hypothetical protein
VDNEAGAVGNHLSPARLNGALDRPARRRDKFPMATDALDEKIEAMRQEAAELRARLALVELRLSAYEESAQLRPSARAVASVFAQSLPSAGRPTIGKRGGRQPGAISRRWQIILKAIAAHYPAGATPADIASFGPAAELHNLKPKDAKQQADKYVQIGYMEQIGDDRYRVTETARNRYGLRIADEGGGEAAIDEFVIHQAQDEEAAIDSDSVAASEHSSGERV